MPSPPPPSVHHIHPLPLSKISSALVYYYTRATRHSTLLLSTPPHRYYYHKSTTATAPSNHTTELLLPTTTIVPSVDCQYINRHNSHIKTNADRKITLLRHSVSVCYHHWVKRQINIYPGGCCHVKMTAFTIACKTAITISHFLIHCPHILTVTTADD